ncbi:hypothetical protein AMS68_006162 [Peltaster fructicola]|uniref:Major facilitator superfamily (MFS) profile domain-containing protein n=1 Tax=Peltaster fructicola TaxID=286661 RepID=A0A6H0Y164_9PEZI|nr:hypothetical protein AMS68_006162 [Peltaster fructicola]
MSQQCANYATFTDGEMAGDSSSRGAGELVPHASLGGIREAAAAAARREKGTEMVPLAGSRRGSEDEDYAVSESGSAQAGVKRLEAISSTWSKWDLYIAYFGLSLVAFAMSLEGQTTTNLTVYATSAFNAHSLVSTVLVVQGVVLSVVKPLMSKIADVFGRSEAFTLSVLIYTIGYVQQAASDSVQTYAAAQIFYSAGQTGLQILIQIFIADTSDLVNRAVCATIPYTPYLINVWVGAPLADTILHRLNWRWGYGVWAVVLPVAYIPLALALMVNQRRAAKKNLLPPSPFEDKTWYETAKLLYYELDIVGLTLLCLAFSFILIPLSLGSSVGWDNYNIITLLVLGGICMMVFPFWERSKKLAPRAFFPGSLFRQKTVLAGLGISFFYFMAYYLSVYPYFQSYLLVVQGKSVTTAGHIIQTWTFAATVTSICVSFAIKRFKKYRMFVTVGACIYCAGLLVMVLFRREGAETWSLVGTQILVGMGGGMLNIPAQTGVQASASHGEVAAATAIFLTFLEVGGACGSAISGAIWSANIPKKLALYLPEETRDQADAIYRNITLASTGWPMDSPTRQAINRGYQETMTYILIVAVCVSVPVIILSLLMEDYKLDEIEQHVKGVVIGGEIETTPDADDEEASEPFIGASSRKQSVSDEESPMLKNKPKRPIPRQALYRKGS